MTSVVCVRSRSSSDKTRGRIEDVRGLTKQLGLRWVDQIRFNKGITAATSEISYVNHQCEKTISGILRSRASSTIFMLFGCQLIRLADQSFHWTRKSDWGSWKTSWIWSKSFLELIATYDPRERDLLRTDWKISDALKQRYHHYKDLQSWFQARRYYQDQQRHTCRETDLVEAPQL